MSARLSYWIGGSSRSGMARACWKGCPPPRSSSATGWMSGAKLRNSSRCTASARRFLGARLEPSAIGHQCRLLMAEGRWPLTRRDGEFGLTGFSRRVGALPTYPMAELPAIKRRLIEQGVDLIDVGAGDADFAPPEIAVKALTRALQDPAMSRYAFQLGLHAFRESAERGEAELECVPAHRRILQRARQRLHRNFGGSKVRVPCTDVDQIHALLDQPPLDRR